MKENSSTVNLTNKGRILTRQQRRTKIFQRLSNLKTNNNCQQETTNITGQNQRLIKEVNNSNKLRPKYVHILQRCQNMAKNNRTRQLR